MTTLIYEGSRIQRMEADGIWYADDDGEEQFISFQACYENYVQERLSPESWERYKELNPLLDQDWDNYVEQTRERRVRVVGDRHVIDQYIEFLTEPRVRFKFETIEAYSAVLLHMRRTESGWWWARDLT